MLPRKIIVFHFFKFHLFINILFIDPVVFGELYALDLETKKLKEYTIVHQQRTLFSVRSGYQSLCSRSEAQRRGRQSHRTGVLGVSGGGKQGCETFPGDTRSNLCLP